jgi:F-type H+-transporting ATPase subunit b
MSHGADDIQATDVAHTAAEAGHAAAAAGAHGGEHAAATFPPFDSSLFSSQLIWFAITFVALYWIVSKSILPKIGGVIATRAATVKGDLDSAAQKSAAAEDARVKMERAIATARSDARAMISAAKADVQAKLNAEQEAAEKRVTARIEAAEAQIDATRQKALTEVGALADGLARDIVAKVAPGAA